MYRLLIATDVFRRPIAVLFHRHSPTVLFPLLLSLHPRFSPSVFLSYRCHPPVVCHALDVTSLCTCAQTYAGLHARFWFRSFGRPAVLKLFRGGQGDVTKRKNAFLATLLRERCEIRNTPKTWYLQAPHATCWQRARAFCGLLYEARSKHRAVGVCSWQQPSTRVHTARAFIQ
jgi:hypothetical protein